MQQRISSILIWSLVIFAVQSCSRGGTMLDDGGGGPHVVTPTDTIPPQITITTPTPNQVFSNGSMIDITGKITDDYGLYRGTIRLTNDANGVSLVNQPYEIHGFLSYNFNLTYKLAATIISDYTVTVSFEDHGLNSTTRSVRVKVNP